MSESRRCDYKRSIHNWNILKESQVEVSKKNTFHGLWFFAGSQANFLASNFHHLNKKCLTHLNGHHITTPASCGLPHEKGSVDAKPSLPSTLQSPGTLVVKTHTGRGRRQNFFEKQKETPGNQHETQYLAINLAAKSNLFVCLTKLDKIIPWVA